MKISYSKVEKYLTCPKMYKLYYIDKLRPDTSSSAFWFGGAIGTVFQAYLLQKKDDLTEEEKLELEKGKNYLKYFDDMIEETTINGEEHTIAYSTKIRYYKADFDESVLEEDDIEEIEDFRKQTGIQFEDGTPLKFDDFITDYIANKITDPDIIGFMNLHFFLSLRRKGIRILNELVAKIAPKITKVYHIEKKIQIDLSKTTDPEMTDYLEGFLDMICDYQVDEEYDSKTIEQFGLAPGDNIKVLFDNKTSSNRYPQKKLDESPQLSIYDYVEQVGYVGYIVSVKKLKTLKKRPDPFVDIQVLIGKSNPELQDTVLDTVEDVFCKIVDGKFPANEDSCKMQFGKPCDYIKFCMNYSTDGLKYKDSDDL